MVFVISRLPREIRTAVRRLAAIIGAHFTQKWTTECTHLVMKKVDFSPKFFFALIQGCFIVSPAYLESFVQHDSGQDFPDPLHFPPDIDPDMEEHLGTTLSLVPNASRMTMFRGIVFIMFDQEQVTKYEQMIAMAGGHVINMCTMTFSEVAQASFVKGNDGSVVVNPHWIESQGGSIDNLRSAFSMLEKVGYRIFDEDLITVAIIRCDMTVFEGRGTSMRDEDQMSVLEQMVEQFEGGRDEPLSQGTAPQLSMGKDDDDDEVVEILDDDDDIDFDDFDDGHMKTEVREADDADVVVEDSAMMVVGDDQVDEIGMEDRKRYVSKIVTAPKMIIRKEGIGDRCLLNVCAYGCGCGLLCRVRDGMISDVFEEYERRETEFEREMDRDDPLDHPCVFFNQKKFKKVKVELPSPDQIFK
jgi:hypothetical protein